MQGDVGNRFVKATWDIPSKRQVKDQVCQYSISRLFVHAWIAGWDLMVTNPLQQKGQINDLAFLYVRDIRRRGREGGLRISLVETF